MSDNNGKNNAPNRSEKESSDKDRNIRRVIFKERNLRAKALDLLLILIGMAFIWMGTR